MWHHLAISYPGYFIRTYSIILFLTVKPFSLNPGHIKYVRIRQHIFQIRVLVLTNAFGSYKFFHVTGHLQLRWTHVTKVYFVQREQSAGAKKRYKSEGKLKTLLKVNRVTPNLAKECTVLPFFKSPTIVIVSPLTVPISSLMVNISSSACVGCSPTPFPALINGLRQCADAF